MAALLLFLTHKEARLSTRAASAAQNVPSFFFSLLLSVRQVEIATIKMGVSNENK